MVANKRFISNSSSRDTVWQGLRVRKTPTDILQTLRSKRNEFRHSDRKRARGTKFARRRQDLRPNRRRKRQGPALADRPPAFWKRWRSQPPGRGGPPPG